MIYIWRIVFRWQRRQLPQCQGYGVVDFEVTAASGAAIKALQAQGIQAQMPQIAQHIPISVWGKTKSNHPVHQEFQAWHDRKTFN